MRSISALAILSASAHLERIEVLIKEWGASGDERKDLSQNMDNKIRLNIASSFAELRDSADAMGVPLTGIAASRAVDKLRARKTPITYKELGAINADVRSRFQDEVVSINMYCLPKGLADYYSSSEPIFGIEVDDRIPASADDIGEAGKCLAVGRFTASVFHLMRALEVAVQHLSLTLGIDNVDKEWGKLLSEMHGKIEVMPKGAERDAWSESHANLYHVKQAWRNGTMHPKRTYTEEEAKEVLLATRTFMRSLARLIPSSVQ
ncbi:hypothetical protein [Sphingomonas aracearum]|uniref:hypothetical protein n=1 Tax=Sphingomonas aracearum TaxID=2283317 RepID=UPI0011C02F71|nr:hypothetical protein [Sphingomonas aracearum]